MSALGSLNDRLPIRYFKIMTYFNFDILNSDIKPENFLLKSKDDISNIKMIDFGLSKDYSETKVMQTPSGSVSLYVINKCYSN